jgi:hypothetical protein
MMKTLSCTLYLLNDEGFVVGIIIPTIVCPLPAFL